MKPAESTDMNDAANSVRDAVKQLNLAYKRSADTLRAVEGPDEVFADALRRAEAVLFAAGHPLSAEQVAETLPPGIDAAEVLMKLKVVYANRGVSLVEVAGKWRFQTAEDLSFLFVEERQQTKRLGQAALETLAIVAYGQPVTRAEIEAVRGVAVSKGVIDTLIEAGWVKIKGRRKTPGRPVTFGTTVAFMEHFGLESLDALPGKADLEAEGLLSTIMPEDFAESLHSDGAMEADFDGRHEVVSGDNAHFVTDFMDETGSDADDD